MIVGSTRSLCVFAYPEPADLRRGFDGLSGLVVAALRRDPLSGDCFLFTNRARTRAKVLLYDGTGLCAYHKLARRQLERLAASLEAQHPGAAASLREGLDETLTLQALGVAGALYRTLCSTNPIENLNGAIAEYTHHVKRWRGGRMILRWVGAAMAEAVTHFRRIRGHDELPKLIAALQRHEEKIGLQHEAKVA